MSIHLAKDLEQLEFNLRKMCDMVLDVIHEGVVALVHRDPECDRRLESQDDVIDASDVRIEDACLKILALHQPVACDLRRIATALKITSELERIADLGVNVAERAAALADLPQIGIPPKLEQMVAQAVDMLERSVAAYIAHDSRAARKICAEDDAVDQLNREIIHDLQETMQRSPHLIQAGMHLFSAARHIERVADHATNIAEDVIYLVEGDIVRHREEIAHPPRRESA